MTPSLVHLCWTVAPFQACVACWLCIPDLSRKNSVGESGRLTLYFLKLLDLLLLAKAPYCKGISKDRSHKDGLCLNWHLMGYWVPLCCVAGIQETDGLWHLSGLCYYHHDRSSLIYTTRYLPPGTLEVVVVKMVVGFSWLSLSDDMNSRALFCLE